MDAPPRLRPLNVIEILDTAFRLFRRNFGTFLAIFALVYIPFATLATVLGGALVNSAVSAAEQKDLALQVLIVSNLALQLIAAPLARGALIRAAADRYLNLPTSIGSAYHHLGKGFFPYVWTLIVSGIPILLGLGLCVIPGCFALVWLFACPEVSILEGKSGFASIKRSFRLSKTAGMRVLGMWAAIVLMSSVIYCAIAAGCSQLLPKVTESPVTQSLLQEGLRHLVALFLLPYFSIAWVLLYYDIRVREEGFDLEVLSRDVGPAAAGR